MTNLEILTCILAAFIGSMPLRSLLNLGFNRAKSLEQKLERPEVSIYCSKAPFIGFFGAVLTFSKGFLPVFFTLYYNYQ